MLKIYLCGPDATDLGAAIEGAEGAQLVDTHQECHVLVCAGDPGPADEAAIAAVWARREAGELTEKGTAIKAVVIEGDSDTEGVPSLPEAVVLSLLSKWAEQEG